MALELGSNLLSTRFLLFRMRGVLSLCGESLPKEPLFHSSCGLVLFDIYSVASYLAMIPCALVLVMGMVRDHVR